jgi:hypothetical protein
MCIHHYICGPIWKFLNDREIKHKKGIIFSSLAMHYCNTMCPWCSWVSTVLSQYQYPSVFLAVRVGWEQMHWYCELNRPSVGSWLWRLGSGNWEARTETLYRATLSIIHAMWTTLKLNTGLYSEKPVSNKLCYGITYSNMLQLLLPYLKVKIWSAAITIWGKLRTALGESTSDFASLRVMWRYLPWAC